MFCDVPNCSSNVPPKKSKNTKIINKIMGLLYKIKKVAYGLRLIETWVWFIYLFTYLFISRGGGEKEGGKHWCAREMCTLMCCRLHTPSWGPGLQSRHVPPPGIKPFWSTGPCSIHWDTPTRVSWISNSSTFILVTFVWYFNLWAWVSSPVRWE